MPSVITVETSGRTAIDVTARIEALLDGVAPAAGVAHLLIQHTSASLTIQENADPDVMRDLLDWLDRMAPENGPYRHTAEGPDDMPAHLKAALTATSLSIPFEHGRLLLGTWQGVYLLEHRASAHQRRIVVALTEAA